MLFVVLGVVALMVLGGAAGALLFVGGSSSSAAVTTAGTATATSNAPVLPVSPDPGDNAVPPPEAPKIEIVSGFKPLVSDVDGDGTGDVVTMLSTEGSGSTEHYAAFSGRTGKELSRSPAIADRNDTVAVVGRRLIAASRAGQLTAFGLSNGSQQWTTALGAHVTAFCAAKDNDSLLVRTDENRQLSVDLTTGRQTETKAPCTIKLVSTDRNPRDRHDYQAPLGTESYSCGGVTVMGSENYTVADQCLARARVDTDRLDGLDGSRLWKVDDNWLVFGIRKPGTRVPMVGLVSRGKLAWKSEIPRDNPLEAQEGSPQHVGISGPLVVAAFTTNKDRHSFLTAFNISDGARRWTVPISDKTESVSALATSANRVFVQAGEQLFLFDSTNGNAIATLGKGR